MKMTRNTRSPDFGDPAAGRSQRRWATSADPRVSAAIARAGAEDGVEAIVPGCTGMADLAARMEELHGLKAIDGVGVAAAFAAAPVNLKG